MTAAEVVEERFIAELRDRVAWQAHAAERLRAEASTAPPRLDLLDPARLRRLVQRNASHPRAAEWRAFLDELDHLTERDGRLPQALERLVGVVFEELL